MDVTELIARGSREIDWDPETRATVAAMVEASREQASRTPRWTRRRRLLVGLPIAALAVGALTAGGMSIANSLIAPADAIIPIDYTASDGSHVSCEVAVTSPSKPVADFIQHHDWSGLSRRLQQAGDRPRSVEQLIFDEIPSRVWGPGSNVDYVNFASSCG